MKVVMLDPGHGGADTGCINDDNLDDELMSFEKDIALDIALAAAQLLNEPALFPFHPEPITAVLTRSADVTLGLKARSDMTKAQRVDLFVSIHHNARVPEQPGLEIETYYLRGMETDSRSARAANAIHASLIEGLSAVDRGVKTANFHVLRETRCPAILVEAGFLTDQQEAMWLNDVRNRQLVAELIVSGVTRYFEQWG